MGLIKKLLAEVVHQQGFEAGVKGMAPRIFFGTEHKAHYYRGYEMGQKAVVARTANKLVDKLTDSE